MKKVKICGLFRPEDIQAVNQYKPDYCGFIINFPKSHRSLTTDRLELLSRDVSPGIKRVGVFVDQPIEFILDLLDKDIIDIAQLHGREDTDYILKLKQLTAKPVWKAFQIHSEEDIQAASHCPADLVLLDSGQGSGQCFDWSHLSLVSRPFALAGGINMTNIDSALETDASLLDISGGAETDKLKDMAKIKALIESVRKNR